jgi:hypothetical protein
VRKAQACAAARAGSLGSAERKAPASNDMVIEVTGRVLEITDMVLEVTDMTERLVCVWWHEVRG